MAEEQEAQEQEKGGSKTMLFVIIGAVLVLIIVGVVVIMLMSGGGEEEEETQAPVKQEQKQGAKKPAGSVGTDVALMNVGPILPITAKGDPLIINLSTQGRDAYLSIQLSVGLSSDKLQVEAERKLDIIKDTFIDVFSTKTPEELKTSKGMNRALEEARNRINEFLVDGQVTHVFRTNAFIQQG